VLSAVQIGSSHQHPYYTVQYYKQYSTFLFSQLIIWSTIQFVWARRSTSTLHHTSQSVTSM